MYGEEIANPEELPVERRQEINSRDGRQKNESKVYYITDHAKKSL